ncbi:adenosylcobinamide-GDP ribazoletransferase [Devosia algicola]|uniref:Adenosylcobinamide-GDP ribazoletransferase n=1 Tax=Devosia algicola TaxID=3026418 RepID=A0ABY7YNI3_9HYPH|nr:adenosylcobinamide-GDP ribazoletransferase [Devosia algicola]WDR02794.1 adenosylcobinamide-GDP ribazoletransferase [Devosia algicola]
MSAEHQGSPPITETREPTVPLDAPPVPGLKADVLMALRFFSRLPTGEAAHEVPNLNRIALALPFASLLIGAGPVALLLLASWLGLPTYFGAALAAGAMVIVTGAMAEDAIADSADGLFGGTTAARRLEIMKDSRHGTYGVASLCLFLILRVAALGSILLVNPLSAVGLWLGATVMARSSALWLAATAAPVRENGASATAGLLLKRNFFVGAGFSLLIGFVLVAPFAGLLGFGLGLALALATVAGWSALCVRLVGGQTGDLVGALVALAEIGLLAGFLAGV